MPPQDYTNTNMPAVHACWYWDCNTHTHQPHHHNFNQMSQIPSGLDPRPTLRVRANATPSIDRHCHQHQLQQSWFHSICGRHRCMLYEHSQLAQSNYLKKKRSIVVYDIVIAKLAESFSRRDASSSSCRTANRPVSVQPNSLLSSQ